MQNMTFPVWGVEGGGGVGGNYYKGDPSSKRLSFGEAHKPYLLESVVEAE